MFDKFLTNLQEKHPFELNVEISNHSHLHHGGLPQRVALIILIKCEEDCTLLPGGPKFISSPQESLG